MSFGALYLQNIALQSPQTNFLWIRKSHEFGIFYPYKALRQTFSQVSRFPGIFFDRDPTHFSDNSLGFFIGRDFHRKSHLWFNQLLNNWFNLLLVTIIFRYRLLDSARNLWLIRYYDPSKLPAGLSAASGIGTDPFPTHAWDKTGSVSFFSLI